MLSPATRRAASELRAAREAFYAFAEKMTLDVFEPELAALPDERRKAVSDAITIVLLWGTWNDFRQNGRSIDEAKAAIRAILVALLGD